MGIMGVIAYNPSEITLKIIQGKENILVYGFSSGNKIWYENGTLKFKVQATSDVNPLLGNMLRKTVKVNLSSTGRDQAYSYLSLFGSGLKVLEIDYADICSDFLPTITYRLRDL